MPPKPRSPSGQPRDPNKPSPFNPRNSGLPPLNPLSPAEDYIHWLKYAQDELDRSDLNSAVQLVPLPLSYKDSVDKSNTTPEYTDDEGQPRIWNGDMKQCQTVSQAVSAPLKGKKHKIGLMIHPPPRVGRERIVSTDENGEEMFEYGKRVESVDGNEVIQYATGHVSLFFIVAAEPGKSGKTLAIWDADTEGEVRRKLNVRKLKEPLQAKEGYSGIQHHLYKHLQGKKGNRLAAWYVGGGGNEGKSNCGALAVDTLLWWVRGSAGELTVNNLGEMGQHKLAK
jgi:hypothetical protein